MDTKLEFDFQELLLNRFSEVQFCLKWDRVGIKCEGSYSHLSLKTEVSKSCLHCTESTRKYFYRFCFNLNSIFSFGLPVALFPLLSVVYWCNESPQTMTHALVLLLKFVPCLSFRLIRCFGVQVLFTSSKTHILFS